MKKWIFSLIVMMTWTNESKAGILPDIFYQSEAEQKTFCSNKTFQNELYWRNLVGTKITTEINNRSQVIQNALVSLSYLELFQANSQYNPARFMGYVYANASHHLGRLIRFSKWPEKHPLSKGDKKLVKGTALRIAAGTASHELSARLMSHSLVLYKELSWSLASATLCGPQYTLSFVQDQNLKEAFKAESIIDFVTPFVTYEQTFLQENMYSDWVIGNAAKSKMLDDMRFISFNGEEHPAFAEWCESINCATSSFDLKNRISYDVYAVKEELKLLARRMESLKKRVNNARIVSTAEVFL